MLTKEEKLTQYYRQVKKTPVLHWAEKHFNWRPRVEQDDEKRDIPGGRKAWFQAILLGCLEGIYRYPEDYHEEKLRNKPINKFAWRIGRQCIPEGTIIHTRDGKLLPIEEHPDAFQTKQNAQIYCLETNTGHSIRTTDNHPISARRNGVEQWIEMGQLQVGDEVEVLQEWDKWGSGLVPFEYQQFVSSGRKTDGTKWEKFNTVAGNYEINEELAELLGLFTADGNWNSSGRKGSLYFTNSNENYLKRFEELIQKYFPEMNTTWYEKKRVIKKNGDGFQKQAFDIMVSCKAKGAAARGNNSFKHFLECMNFHSSGFPRAVAEHFSKEQVIAFLRGLWMGDGNFYCAVRKETGTYYEATLACNLKRPYAEYCQSLFNKLGINLKLKTQVGKLATAPFYLLRSRNKLNLQKMSFLFGDIDGKFVPELVGRYNDKSELIKHTRANHGEQLSWGKIQKITKEEKFQNCYDVEYPGKGWFLGSNIVVHNSGKTECLALAVLYLSLRKPIRENKPKRHKFAHLVSETDTGWRRVENWETRGAKIIMASADASKARIVFDRVLNFIEKSKLYKAALEEGMISIRLNPFPTLTFNIPGWTEPAIVTFRGPGANGQTARGSTFDYKLYDEADYMPNSFFEAELATSINAGKNSLTILSSTPTGKRDYFHAACFQEDAPVSMADGTLKPISEVRTGDMVFNRYGVPEQVTDTFKRPYKGKIVSFTTTLNNTIVTGTGNHRIMAVHKKHRFCKSCEEMVWKNRTACVIHGSHKGLPDLKPDYVMLRDLNVGDFIAIPKNLVNSKKIKFCAEVDEFVYVAIDDIHSEMVESKPVYNLEVGEDHSYCVNGYGVANCTNPEYHFEEFHFPSFENPNYTPELDATFRVQLTAAGYEHEILADWGTTEYGVFNWVYFEKVFDHKYKHGETKNKLYVPGDYEVIKLTAQDLGKIGLQNLTRYLRAKMPARKDNHSYYFGADLGYKTDPSEMVIFEQFNGVMKLILRINLQNVTYEIQGDMIAFLDRIYMFDALGMDEGGNGLSLKQMLQTANIFDKTGYNKYAQHRFDLRLHAINFGQKMILGRQHSKDQTVPAKQWMTDLIIKQAEEKLLILPNLDYDKEVENQFRNHTFSMSSNGTIVYSKSDVYPDHIVDAVRTAFYARQHTFLPKARKWPVGNAFRANGTGGWR